MVTIDDFIKTTAQELTEYMGTLKITDMNLGVDITKGKKLRGSLVILISDCLTGDKTKSLEFASAVELIHLGSLVHDDVIDEHQERRGTIPLNLLQGARLAVLTGDRMFSLATKIASRSGNREAIEVADAMETVLSGAMKEISLSEFAKDILTGQVADKFYYKMIGLKTAGLFRSAGRFGAMTSTDKLSIIELFGNYGESVGMAYQIADDLADIIKLSEGTKEPDLGNIVSTVPAVLHYNRQYVKQAPFAMMSGRISMDKILDMITSMDMSDKMKLDIKDHIDQAESIIQNFEIQNEFTKLLEELPRYCVNQQLEEVGEKISTVEKIRTGEKP